MLAKYKKNGAAMTIKMTLFLFPYILYTSEQKHIVIASENKVQWIISKQEKKVFQKPQQIDKAFISKGGFNLPQLQNKHIL